MMSTDMQDATRWLIRPAGRIAYDDSGGAGPLVVAIPGLGDLRQEYRFLAPRLVAAGYRVVTMDVRGHGESSVDWPDYFTQSVGADALALVESLKAGPALLIGTSMAGGAIAWAAAERPDLVAGLVLINPFVRPIPASALQTLMVKTLMRRPWGPTAWGYYYQSLYPTQRPADFDEYKVGLVANLKQPGRFEAAVAMMNDDKAAIEPRLGEVRAPALVLMGSKDPDFPDPAAEGRLVAERLRGATNVIDGAGHYPHVEFPEPTAAQVLTFLAEAREAMTPGR